MLLLDGKVVRDSRVTSLKNAVRELGFTPMLAILQVGDSERSHAYVSAKQKFAERIGVRVEFLDFSPDVSGAEVLSEIERLNADPSVNGIIV